MIPTVIHFCWFGRKEKPESFYRWLKTWRNYMPDYEIKEWNEDNFNVNSTVYSREAYATGNMAHVSDVCRIYALSEEGGIYLDTDIEICTPFDSLPDFPNGFLGEETDGFIGTGVIAAPAGALWLSKFMDYYRHTHFINALGHEVRSPNTKILTYRILPAIEVRQRPHIYPPGVIAMRKAPDVMPDGLTTIAIHHFNYSWRRRQSLAEKIARMYRGFKIRHGFSKLTL